jgi:SAM-dependent methyltransferase
MDKSKQKLRRRDWVNKPATERVRILGHRALVGGTNAETWYGIGKRQYHWLVSQGLRPDHRFLDIACGSLRLGQFLIPYLGRGCYFGLEPEPELVRKGLEEELLFDLATVKAPRFGHGYDFDFSFLDGYDFAIAQSLLTHLAKDDIALLLRNLRSVSNPDSRFFFTFFEGDGVKNPKGPSHANKSWHYGFGEIYDIAHQAGWSLTYIGDWSHARGQKMVLARPG